MSFLASISFRTLLLGVCLVYLVLDCVLKGPVHSWCKPWFSGTTERQSDWAAKVNDRPITRAQRELAVDLLLARKGQIRADLTPDALEATRLGVLGQLIDDELVRICSEAEPVRVPESVLEHRVQQFESRFAPGELAVVLAAQGLSQQEFRSILRDQACQEFWLEEKTRSARTVSEADIQRWQDRHGTRIRMPEMVRARHLFLSSVYGDVAAKEKLVPELANQLGEGRATFEELCPRFSDDDRTKLIGGELGYFSRERVPADFAAPVFAQEPGKVGSAFRTKIGWHIVQVEERLPARELSWEELRPELTAFLENESRQPAIQALLRRLREEHPLHVEIYPSDKVKSD